MFVAAKHFRLRPLAALLLACTSSAFAAPVAFDQPAQSLQAAIEQVGKTGSVSITVDSQLVAGKQAPALKGTMEPSDALRKLLAGSGLEVGTKGSSLVVLKALEGKRPSEVSVEADAPKEGSAEVGYRPITAKTTGPWGAKAILDTPYSINVIPSDQIENMISGGTDTPIKFSPTMMQSTPSTANGNQYGVVRGFYISEVTRDGIPMRYSWLSSVVEDLDRVEILTGLSGFLYGPGNVGGLMNQVSKRPTLERLANVSVGNYGGGQYFVHADLGGPIDQDGKVAYRLNVATTEGDTEIKEQSVRKQLISGAIDWKITNDLLVQLNLAHTEYHENGTTGALQLYGLSSLPSASQFDNKKLLTPGWSFFDVKSDRIGSSFNWKISDTSTFRGAFLHYEETREAKNGAAWIQANGSVWQGYSHAAPAVDKNDGGYLYFDSVLNTGPLQHKFTIGANYSGYKLYQHADGSSYSEVLYSSLDEARNAAAINWPSIGNQPKYMSTKINYLSTVIGDEISIGDKWSVLLGVNHASISSDSYNSSGISTGNYDKSAITPSISLIYKPTPNMSTYLSYIESMEAGPVVSTSASPVYTNAGTVLSPTISKQVELGVKASISGVLIAGSLYQIEKANNYDLFNSDGTRTLTQDGKQVHKGIEITASGKLTDRLSISGGGTIVDAKIEKTNTSIDDGKTPEGIPHMKIGTYAEYRLPFAERLYLTGGVSHLGKSEYKSALTNQRIDRSGFTIGDIGLRYESRMLGNNIISRLIISNVTDENYWLPSPYGGVLGAPRTISYSATMKF